VPAGLDATRTSGGGDDGLAGKVKDTMRNLTTP
jgi:hypothetical protein